MKTSKEELIKENAILKQNNKDLWEQNEKLRDDFCRILHFVSYDNYYGTRQEKLEKRTWAELFAQVGRLLESQKRLDYISDVERLTLKVKELEVNHQELEMKIRKEIHPNL